MMRGFSPYSSVFKNFLRQKDCVMKLSQVIAIIVVCAIVFTDKGFTLAMDIVSFFVDSLFHFIDNLPRR
jgi:hypothetical protein